MTLFSAAASTSLLIGSLLSGPGASRPGSFGVKNISFYVLVLSSNMWCSRIFPLESIALWILRLRVYIGNRWLSVVLWTAKSILVVSPEAQAVCQLGYGGEIQSISMYREGSNSLASSNRGVDSIIPSPTIQTYLTGNHLERGHVHYTIDTNITQIRSCPISRRPSCLLVTCSAKWKVMLRTSYIGHSLVLRECDPAAGIP